jgi:hypothetical protein
LLTYAEARARVHAALAEAWQAAHPGGTFHVADEGYEDGEDFLVPVGNHDGLPLDIVSMDDAPAVFVSKKTGAVRTEETIPTLPKIAAMRPVR